MSQPQIKVPTLLELFRQKKSSQHELPESKHSEHSEGITYVLC